MEDNYLNYKFLRFSLGIESPDAEDKEWLNKLNGQKLFDFARRQSLLGIFFDGIAKLKGKHAIDRMILLKWYATAETIKEKNKLLFDKSAEIHQQIKGLGFDNVILKGQGNALLYPNMWSRSPGDIDVWVNCSRKELRGIAHALTKNKDSIGEESLNHIELRIDNISVELHATPAIVCNFLHNKRLQKWIAEKSSIQWNNIERTPEKNKPFAVPTISFNLVYQLIHLYHHYFFEGVSLKQIVDYYFVLKTARRSNLQPDETITTIKELGIYGFAGAVMYVLQEILGLEQHEAIAPTDKKRGKALLTEIQHNDPQAHAFRKNMLKHNTDRLKRDMMLLRHYPQEALCEPAFRIYHYLWRMTERKELQRKNLF